MERASDLATAVMAALSFAGAAIVEAKVEGSEVAVGVVGRHRTSRRSRWSRSCAKSGVFDYASRYTAGATEYFAPARVTSEVAAACTEQALRATGGLRLRDVARVDAIVDAGGHTVGARGERLARDDGHEPAADGRPGRRVVAHRALRTRASVAANSR